MLEGPQIEPGPPWPLPFSTSTSFSSLRPSAQEWGMQLPCYPQLSLLEIDWPSSLSSWKGLWAGQLWLLSPSQSALARSWELWLTPGTISSGSPHCSWAEAELSKGREHGPWIRQAWVQVLPCQELAVWYWTSSSHLRLSISPPPLHMAMIISNS